MCYKRLGSQRGKSPKEATCWGLREPAALPALKALGADLEAGVSQMADVYGGGASRGTGLWLARSSQGRNLAWAVTLRGWSSAGKPDPGMEGAALQAPAPLPGGGASVGNRFPRARPGADGPSRGGAHLRRRAGACAGS